MKAILGRWQKQDWHYTSFMTVAFDFHLFKSVCMKVFHKYDQVSESMLSMINTFLGGFGGK